MPQGSVPDVRSGAGGEGAAAAGEEDPHRVAAGAGDGQVLQADAVEVARDDRARSDADRGRDRRAEAARAVAEEHEDLVGGLARHRHVGRAVAVEVAHRHRGQVVAHVGREAGDQEARSVAQVDLDLARADRAEGRDHVGVAVEVEVGGGHSAGGGAHRVAHRGAVSGRRALQKRDRAAGAGRGDEVGTAVLVEVGGGDGHRPVAGRERTGRLERGLDAGRTGVALHHHRLIRGREHRDQVRPSVGGEVAGDEALGGGRSRKRRGERRRSEERWGGRVPPERHQAGRGQVEDDEVEDSIPIQVRQGHAARLPEPRDRRLGGEAASPRALEDRHVARAAVRRHEVEQPVPVDAPREDVARIRPHGDGGAGSEGPVALPTKIVTCPAALNATARSRLPSRLKSPATAAVGPGLLGDRSRSARVAPKTRRALALEDADPVARLADHDEVEPAVSVEVGESEAGGHDAHTERDARHERAAGESLVHLHLVGGGPARDDEVESAVPVDVARDDVHRARCGAPEGRGRQGPCAVAQQDAERARRRVGDGQVERPVLVEVPHGHR